MRQLLLTLCVACGIMYAHAQKVCTVDRDGQPVPYASVMTTDARIIGITDLHGVLADVHGADTIIVTHVAYNTRTVALDGRDGSVTLDEKDFGLPEIVVKSKPLVYAQTYYRLYMYDDSLGIDYYRAGLTDNSYERATKEAKYDTRHTSKASMGLLKAILNMAFGRVFDRVSHISMKTVEERMRERYKELDITVVQQGPDRKEIHDSLGLLGTIVNNHQTATQRISIEASKAYNHHLQALGKTKKLEKREKHDAKRQNKQETYYYVYRIDENGRYALEDMMMMQFQTSWDEKEDNGRLAHKIMSVEVYTTDRASVDKSEMKQRKKDNKMKMSYQNIRDFERTHDIPPLAPAIQKKLDELWKVDKEE